ncbi:MAG: amidinotransferase [Pseudomonadota bacterium]
MTDGVFHHFERAIVREPSVNLGDGLTTTDLEPPDFARALRQHAAYVEALRSAGLDVITLPTAGHPDGHFVEDTALVFPEVAVITRPGMAVRRPECEAIAAALTPLREVRTIDAPGRLDGGDVLIVGRRCFVGLSARTDTAGVAQLEEVIAAFGYSVVAVDVGAGLHLKSSVNLVDETTLLATPALAELACLAGLEVLVVPPDEAYAANVVRVNESLLVPAGFARTRELLSATDARIVPLDVSEFHCMDGGLTCLSLRF